VKGRSGEEVSFTVRRPSGEQKIEGSDILVAAGRVPNTAGIGLKEAGVELDGRGYIRVNERLETTAPNVWAIGECAGSPQFTHASQDDFRIIRDNLAGGNRSTRDRLVPYCMFTDPPLAHVGLSEAEAKRQGVAARVAKLPMKAVRRTATTDETQGFMKVLVGASDDRILGFTMIGAEAGEVMTVVQTAMLAGLPYPKLPRCRYRPPDDRGRPRPALLERAGPIGLAQRPSYPDQNSRLRARRMRRYGDSIGTSRRSGRQIGRTGSTELNRSPRLLRTAGMGYEDRSHDQGRTAGVGSVKRPSPGLGAMGETRR